MPVGSPLINDMLMALNSAHTPRRRLYVALLAAAIDPVILIAHEDKDDDFSILLSRISSELRKAALHRSHLMTFSEISITEADQA